MPLKDSAAAPPRVALADVRRLVVERADPIAGRCRYVADLGARQVPQPILLARRGEVFDGVIENALPQPTTVHFHGLTLPEAADGAGFDAIAPGARKRVRFEVRNRSGLYWFHPHPHGFTAEQVYGGLTGLLVVSDEDDDALDAALALAPGNRLALAVAEARVAGGAMRPYAPSVEDCLHGWLGNRALVNGQLDARWSVSPGWVRLQILNACNARGLLVAFREGETLAPFHLLGTDGGFLAAPRELDRVFLYTGERVDIAIDPGGRRALAAVSLGFDPRHHTQGAAPRHRHPARERYAPLAAGSVCENAPGSEPQDRLADGAELPLFALRVDGTSMRAPPPPSRLSALAEPAAGPEATTRRMRLDFDEGAGFLIDQTPYRVDETAFSVSRGTREVWEIKNSPISMPHPMHLHGFGFRVLRRQGTYGDARRLATEPGGRLATDLGVKDTVVLWPNETLWLAMDFALPQGAAFRGAQRFMFHCHNLEHEDGMMMRNFTVI
ncbi:MAG TPA: multicopper oxidase domain-containing protein [Burkholderiales bacterium]|nr:multicopper oxidase domain-containing protein [Burkholderiales bacterium]